MHRGADINFVSEGADIDRARDIHRTDPLDAAILRKQIDDPIGKGRNRHIEADGEGMPVRTALSVTENIPDTPLTLVPDSATPTLPVTCGRLLK
jgi:hypothetical protein